MPRNLHQWQSRLENLDPGRIELGLDRIRTVFNKLSLNISDAKIILVAGTNGKGSTVAALQALLIQHGMTVGSYTSPHLQRFNERIQFQGVPLDDQDLVSAFERVEALRSGTALTYFEFVTLAAIVALAAKQPQYLIFEVGLGGRLDAVNILDADLSIITGIALDHTEWLGEDLQSIGFEKAGIYRSGKPAIFASAQIPDSVKKRISDIDAVPILFGEQINASIDQQNALCISICLDGSATQTITVTPRHLPETSITAAVTAFAVLGFPLTHSLSTSISAVQLPGRYQKLQVAHTPCILDVAHNPQAAEYLAKRLQAEDIQAIAAIVGVMADKDLAAIYRPLLAIVENWYLVAPNTPRAASVQTQKQTLMELGVCSENLFAVGDIALMQPYLDKMPAAIVFGSFYTVGEFLDCFGDRH